MLYVFNKIFRRRKRPWPNFEYYPEISERDWDKLGRTWVRMVGGPTHIPNDCLPNSLPFQPTCLVTEHHITGAEFGVMSAVLMILNCSSMFRRGYWRIIADISVERSTSAFIVRYCYTVRFNSRQGVTYRNIWTAAIWIFAVNPKDESVCRISSGNHNNCHVSGCHRFGPWWQLYGYVVPGSNPGHDSQWWTMEAFPHLQVSAR